jgi:mediator of RNA polymerase II transcription subunit 7
LYDPTNLGIKHQSLFHSLDHKTELKKLNLSLLFNHYLLIDVLIEDPEKSTEVQEQILKIFLNFHHLLNSLRPHQAREALITTMDAQIERRKKFLEELTKYVASWFN